MKEDSDSLNKFNLLKSIFYKDFEDHGINSMSTFDYSVYFIREKFEKNKFNNKNLKECFIDFLTATPKEDQDIVQFILMKIYKNSQNKNFQIYVGSFIEEISRQLISLNKENERLTNLIDKYSAYEIVNSIDQNIAHFDKYEERTLDVAKSSFTVSIQKIKGIPHGDYTFSILISQMDDNILENYEYKLNHVINIELDNNSDIYFHNQEYVFPVIDFFCNESGDLSKNKTDSGTNLLSFQIKMENLNKNFTDSLFSEKFNFFQLLIANSKALMNNFQKTKILDANVYLRNSFYDVQLGLIFKVEFDPITLMAVFNKISKLLKDIITYKIKIENKIKTIYIYFESISEKIENILNPKKEEEKKCYIF